MSPMTAICQAVYGVKVIMLGFCGAPGDGCTPVYRSKIAPEVVATLALSKHPLPPAPNKKKSGTWTPATLFFLRTADIAYDIRHSHTTMKCHTWQRLPHACISAECPAH